MRTVSTLDTFRSRYSGIGFERGGLFRLLREEFRPDEVLYPGCSIHITPACWFPRVVFVDKDPAAAEFFSRRAEILEFLRRNRIYRRIPDIRFIHQSFTDPIPVRRSEFDLLLSLFTGGVAKSCHPYLKSGGLLLTDGFHGDAADAVRTGVFEPAAAIAFRKGKYAWTDWPEGRTQNPPGAGRTKRYLVRSADGLTFRDEETYLLFRKAARRR